MAVRPRIGRAKWIGRASPRARGSDRARRRTCAPSLQLTRPSDRAMVTTRLGTSSLRTAPKWATTCLARLTVTITRALRHFDSRANSPRQEPRVDSRQRRFYAPRAERTAFRFSQAILRLDIEYEDGRSPRSSRPEWKLSTHGPVLPNNESMAKVRCRRESPVGTARFDDSAGSRQWSPRPLERWRRRWPIRCGRHRHGQRQRCGRVWITIWPDMVGCVA